MLELSTVRLTDFPQKRLQTSTPVLALFFSSDCPMPGSIKETLDDVAQVFEDRISVFQVDCTEGAPKGVLGFERDPLPRLLLLAAHTGEMLACLPLDATKAQIVDVVWNQLPSCTTSAANSRRSHGSEESEEQEQELAQLPVIQPTFVRKRRWTVHLTAEQAVFCEDGGNRRLRLSLKEALAQAALDPQSEFAYNRIEIKGRKTNHRFVFEDPEAEVFLQWRKGRLDEFQGRNRGQEGAVPEDPQVRKKKAMKRNGWILLALALGLGIGDISGLRPGGFGVFADVGVFVDVFRTGCIVGGIVCFVAAARIRIRA